MKDKLSEKMCFCCLVIAASILFVFPGVMAESNTVDVSIGDFFFDPDFLSVPAGTTVMWTNAGNLAHTVTSNDGVWDSGNLDPGETFSRTFETPGEYPYFCTYHPASMQARVEVYAPTTGAGAGPEAGMPETFHLAQNDPNPFNPETDIRYRIAGNRPPQHTTLVIYNILGHRVRTLVNAVQAPGSYTVSWDGRNKRGREVSSGLYLYRLSSGHYKKTKLMVFLK